MLIATYYVALGELVLSPFERKTNLLVRATWHQRLVGLQALECHRRQLLGETNAFAAFCLALLPLTLVSFELFGFDSIHDSLFQILTAPQFECSANLQPATSPLMNF